MKKLNDLQLHNVGGNHYLTANDMKAKGMELPKQRKPINDKFCSCPEPDCKIESNELFESWYMCTKCNKEII